MILYAMVYRTMPFHGADFNQLKKQIAKGDFVEPPELSGKKLKNISCPCILGD